MQTFGYVILGDDSTPIQLEKNDPNSGNVCFASYYTLSKIGIEYCGYKLLKTNESSHIVMIFGTNSIVDNVIGMTPVLADNLMLKSPEAQLRVESIQLNLGQSKAGLPNFPQASKIEVTPIYNHAYQTVFEPSLLKKVRLQPFYFQLGQQIRLKVDSLSINLVRDQKLPMKKSYIKAKRIATKEKNASQCTLRLVITGVHYKDEKLSDQMIYEVIKQKIDKPNYYLFHEGETIITYEPKSIKRMNTLANGCQLSPCIRDIFKSEPYHSLGRLLQTKTQQNNGDPFASVVMIHSKEHYMIDEFLKTIADLMRMNYFELDCSLQFNVSPIQNFSKELYKKTPCMGHIKNIEWIYDLQSGNLDAKRNSQKIVEICIKQFRESLLNRSDKYPAILVLSYTHDPFEIKDIEVTHFNFEPTTQEQQTMQSMLVESYIHKLSKQSIDKIKEISKPLPWGQIQKILSKVELVDSIIKEIDKTVKKIVVAKIPEVKWSDIGGLDVAKQEIIETILLPKNHPDIFDDLIRPRTGLLFYGPPGTGKTLLAKCIANECKMNFISVKGPEMLNMYIGQSEKNVRQTFEKAAQNRPCIIFFDELDALVPKRGSTSDSSQVMDRIVAELLSQMDMTAKVGGVFVIGATNRPDLLDPSIMRPGRFDKQIYLGICTNKDDRIRILEAQTNKLLLSEDVDFSAIVDQLPQNFTGADFYGLTSKAVTNALNKRIKQIQQGTIQKPESQAKISICHDDFKLASQQVKPSVTMKELEKFQQLKAKYS